MYVIVQKMKLENVNKLKTQRIGGFRPTILKFWLVVVVATAKPVGENEEALLFSPFCPLSLNLSVFP